MVDHHPMNDMKHVMSNYNSTLDIRPNASPYTENPYGTIVSRWDKFVHVSKRRNYSMSHTDQPQMLQPQQLPPPKLKAKSRTKVSRHKNSKSQVQIKNYQQLVKNFANISLFETSNFQLKKNMVVKF